MRFILTGGGTGGHFYPLIAVTEELNQLQLEHSYRELELFFLSTQPYDQTELDRHGLTFQKIIAGKNRAYFSPLNVLDWFKTALGLFQALWRVFVIYPDAVFSKGGFAAFPVVVAAIVLRIPIIIHESDTVPGRVNRWTGRWAKTVFLAFDEAKQYFPKHPDIRIVGLPIRRALMELNETGAREFLHLKEDLPVIVVLGGSQGAQEINNLIINSLPKLIENYYIIHQTGRENILAVKQAAKYILQDSPHSERYKPFDYLDTKSTQMAAALARLVVSRAGSGLFEIAAWGVPSILIPLPHAHGQHQLHNARVYYQAGACLVIEEDNLKTSVFLAELESLINNPARLEKMSQAAREFHRPQAARTVAETLTAIGEEHES